MSESSDTNVNDDIQQTEQKGKQSYHDKNIEHIKRMSERSKMLKQQQLDNEKQKPPEFKLHFNGANKDDKKETFVANKLTQSKIVKTEAAEDKNNIIEKSFEDPEDNDPPNEDNQISSTVSEISERPEVQYPRNVSLVESQIIFQENTQSIEQQIQDTKEEDNNLITLSQKINDPQPTTEENQNQEKNNIQEEQLFDPNNEDPPIMFDGLEENSDENFGSEIIETVQNDQDYIQSDDLKLIKSEGSFFVPETLLNLINSLEKFRSIPKINTDNNNMANLQPQNKEVEQEQEKCTELNLFEDDDIVENLSTSIQKDSSDLYQDDSLRNITQKMQSINIPNLQTNANEKNAGVQNLEQAQNNRKLATLNMQTVNVETLQPQAQQTMNTTIAQPSLSTLKQSQYPTNLNKNRVIASKLMENLKQKGISNVDQYVNSLDNEGKQKLISDIDKIENDINNEQNQIKQKPHVKSVMQICKSERLPVQKLPQVLHQAPSNLPPRYKSTQVQDNMKQVRALVIQIISCYVEGDKVNGITLPNLMCNNKIVPVNVFYSSVADQQKSIFVTNKIQHIDAVPTTSNRVYMAPAQMNENNQYFLRPHPSKQGLSQPKDIIVYDMLLFHSNLTDSKKLVQSYAFSKPGQQCQSHLILRQTKLQLPRGTGLLIQDIEINLGEKMANSVATTATNLKQSQSCIGANLSKLENNPRRSSMPILAQSKDTFRIGQMFETSADLTIQMCILETFGQSGSVSIGNVQILLQNDVSVNVKSMEIVDTKLTDAEVVIKGARQSTTYGSLNVEEGKGDLLVISRKAKVHTQYDGITVNFKFDIHGDQMGQSVQCLLYKCAMNGDVPKMCYFFVNGQPVSPLTCIQMSPVHILKQQILLKSSSQAIQQLQQKAKAQDKPVQQYIWENLKKQQIQTLFQKKVQTVLNSYMIQSGNRYFSIRFSVITQHKQNHASTIYNVKVYNAFKEEIEDIQIHESSKINDIILDILIYRPEPIEYCMLQFASRNCKAFVVSMDRKLMFQGSITDVDVDVVSISLSKGVKGPGHDKILVQ